MTYREFLTVQDKEQAYFDSKLDAKYNAKARAAVRLPLGAEEEETVLAPEPVMESLFDSAFHYPHFFGK